MRKFWIISLSLILLVTVVIYWYTRLPYGLRIVKIDTTYGIHDQAGYPVIAEGYHINDDEKFPVVKKIIEYSKNELGLVVHIISEDSLEWYVAIKPKEEQHYLPELEVDYRIFTKEEYLSLKIKDDWFKVRWRENIIFKNFFDDSSDLVKQQ